MVNIAENTDELKNHITGIIKDYDNQGIHRTGMKVDKINADWLVGEIRKIGLIPELEKFPINRIDIKKCFLNQYKLTINTYCINVLVLMHYIELV